MRKERLIQLQEERAAILEDLGSIEGMRRGHISEQTFPGKQGGRRGPYHVFQRWENKRNRCRRVPPEEIDQLREEVGNYKRFKELTERLAAVIEEITELCQSDPDSKKNSGKRGTSVSRRAKKSSNWPGRR